MSANTERINATIENLKKYPLKWIYPGHCTGFYAQTAIYKAFPKKFGILHSGLFLEE